MRSILRRALSIGTMAASIAVVLLIITPVSSPATAQSGQGVVTMEWLGHMFFRFTTSDGLVVLTTPNFSQGAPISPDQIARADIILIPNGHTDDRGQVLDLAPRTRAKVVAPTALGEWLVSQGLERDQLVGTGTGSLHLIDGIQIRTVQNIHDERISGSENNQYGGAVGYIIMFPNGFTAYFAASSDITMDMQLYGSIYKPHVAMLNAAGRDPMAVAEMARLISTNNPNLREIVPTHIRFGDPQIQRVSDAVRAAGLSITVLDPAPGQIYEYGPEM